MMRSPRTPINLRFDAGRADETDGLLRRYFQSELPHPWPAAPAVEESAATLPMRPGPMRRFFRVALSPRVAVAAAVVLLVLGYAAMQTWFPDPKPNLTPIDTTDPTASKLLPGQTPNRSTVSASLSGQKKQVGAVTIQELPDKK